MNTIQGLKALPSILVEYQSEIEQLEYKRDQCLKPFKDIIQKVFAKQMAWCYIDNIRVHNDKVYFKLKYSRDDEDEGDYSYPLETFISAETLNDHLYKLEREAIKKNLADIEAAQSRVDDAERANYERLKIKFQGK